jgi:hypothetical protein
MLSSFFFHRQIYAIEMLLKQLGSYLFQSWIKIIGRNYLFTASLSESEYIFLDIDQNESNVIIQSLTENQLLTIHLS